MKCKGIIAGRGVNYSSPHFKTKTCPREAIEGTSFCKIHTPKDEKSLTDGQKRLQMELYLMRLRNKNKK